MILAVENVDSRRPKARRRNRDVGRPCFSCNCGASQVCEDFLEPLPATDAYVENATRALDESPGATNVVPGYARA